MKTGEFINIRGYGNMARKMGHHYERLNVPSNAIPITPLIEIVHSVIEKIRTGPSCILPSVISDPYFLAKT